MPKPSQGLIEARKRSRERITAGTADREAGKRYAELASRMADDEPMKQDYVKRSIECERLAKRKLTAIA